MVRVTPAKAVDLRKALDTRYAGQTGRDIPCVSTVSRVESKTAPHDPYAPTNFLRLPGVALAQAPGSGEPHATILAAARRLRAEVVSQSANCSRRGGLITTGVPNSVRR